jgi:hypothetical protein
MHPKRLSDIEVSHEDLAASLRAFDWFLDQFRAAMHAVEEAITMKGRELFLFAVKRDKPGTRPLF